MSNTEPAVEKLSKFQRYRRNQRAKGKKLLRIWVPDPSAEGFFDESKRQADLLRGSEEELEAIAFIDAVFELNEK